MEKKYQVFVSSTYVDLIEERKEVIQALLESDCIPVGMEMFQATDEEQWSFIKQVISDCDYYILVVAGRYGSLTKEGISYTEKEFQYAVESKIPVLAFIHNDLDSIPSGKTDQKDELREKLKLFMNRVQTNRLIKKWSNGSELATQVIKSINHAKKATPRIGWIKADNLLDEDSLRENIELRKKIDLLEDEIKQLKSNEQLPSLSIKGTTNYVIKFEYEVYQTATLTEKFIESKVVKWFELINFLCSELFIANLTSSGIRNKLETYLLKISNLDYDGAPPIKEFALDADSLKVILAQLVSFELVEHIGNSGLGETYWGLTSKGRSYSIDSLIKTE